MSTELLEQGMLLVHLILALAIIALIMLQQGKGAEMGASFGAGASQTLFGSSGSGNVLTRTTAWMVAFFFATSFGLAVLAKQKTEVQDSLGIPLPAMQRDLPSSELPAPPGMDSEIPQVEQTEPAMRADGAAQGMDDMGGMEGMQDVPAPEGDLPVLPDGAE
jgi:preprotein translocase subunit SecG